jgi:hypothetical protein
METRSVTGKLRRPLAILKWLARAAKRNRSSFTSFGGNNLNYTAVASMFMLDPALAGILLLIMGVIVILPLSSDPLRAIPRVRLNIWPLEKNERRILRLISPWLNPMTWIVVALAVWKRASLGIVALAAGVVTTGFLTSARAGGGAASPWRSIPQLPGPLNHLIRKNLREMLSTLDFFCAALIAVAALGWRLAGLLPPAAFFPLTIVAMLAISTCALSLFGLDGAAGLMRYCLMPLRGWQILIAKDAAFMTIAVILALPLSIPGATGAAMIALAVGHRTSIRSRRPQLRWRFQTGPSFGDAIAQIIPMTMAGAAIVYSSKLVLLPCIAVWAASTWYFGREIDRTWH